VKTRSRKVLHVISFPKWGAQTMSSRRFHGVGLFYAAIPLLAGACSAYQVATTQLERHTPINWLSIFVPRLGLALILAFIVYGLFRAAGSLIKRLHGVALAAQPTWRFITLNQPARFAASLEHSTVSESSASP
jgi:hypothetical protein